MIKSILVESTKNYEKQEGDLIIAISESDLPYETNFNFFFDMSDYSHSPKEVEELEIKRFSWDNHRMPIVKILRDARESDYTRLVILSKYPDQEAMGLALGISESKEFKGKFTEELLKQASSDFDITTTIDYLDLRNNILDFARVKFADKVFDLTRYELMDKVSFDDVMDIIFNKSSNNRKEPLDCIKLLEYVEDAE